MTTDTTDDTATTADLARWLGCTDRAVRDYAAKGIIAPVSRGRWPLRASVAAVIDHLRAVASQHRSERQPGDDGEPDPLDLTGQRALLAKRQRERIEVEMSEKARELVSVEEVKAQWFKRTRTARDRLMALPASIAPLLAAQTDPDDVYRLLEVELRRTLEMVASEPITGATEPQEAQA